MSRTPATTRLLFALAATGCLPDDTRPRPAELLVTATASEALQRGVATAETRDGFALEFEPLLASLGHVSMEGDDCTGYSDPDYERILLLQGPEPQKVGLVFALGRCDLDFELSGVSRDAVLGEGVSEADRALMMTPASDGYGATGGLTMRVRGRATRGGEEKRFDWAYRKRIDYATCGRMVSGRRVDGLELRGGESVTVDLTAHAEGLFQDQLDPATAALGFEPMAAADRDEDGTVTLAELDAVPLAAIQGPGHYDDVGAPAEPGEEGPSLADYLYAGLFPRVVRFGGDGTCETEILNPGTQ